MTQQIIAIGTVANDGLGDTWRDAMDKSNDNFTELYGLTAVTKRVLVNSLSDFPSPVSNVITLASDTQYLLANDVALGSNRIVMANNSAIDGIESLVVTLSSSTTGDLFTSTDANIRVSNLTISAPNARLFNWSETAGSFLRANDITISSANKLGLFTGTTGVIRMTSVSGSLTSDGADFTGNFSSALFQESAISLAAGVLFELGTATFNSFICDILSLTLGGGAVFLSGATASANINTNGGGVIDRVFTAGTGTVLSGITPDDARWSFSGNDNIADTRPDALLYMQSNTTQTVILAAGTYVLTAGTWTVDSTSQTTGTIAGRVTYDGVKDARVPITASLTVEPASGVNKSISVRVAINGATVAGSERTVTTDAGSPLSITVPWQETLSNGDYVEIFVANNTDTIDILVSSAILRVS